MRRTTVFILACALGAFLSAAAASAGSVIRVSPAGNDSSSGLSWEDAKQTVTVGLAAAVAGDQVWVAAGTYVERITLKANVAFYGGFTGTETTLAERPPFPRTAPDANETILDGNQGGSVVTSPSGATTTTRIDGFTIRNGNGTLSGSYRYGGGIYCFSSSPTITNCTITGNTGFYGGGMYNYDNSHAVLTNCRFDGNQASVDGGGLCTFYNSNVTLTACVFSGNSASSRGGGVCNDASFSTLANCTFSGNQANYGGGMCNASGIPVMANCIVWGNAANHGSQLYDYGLTATVMYNCVQSGWPGEGNIDVDPLFVRNASPGADGQWGTEDDDYGDLRLRAGSLCIDAGDNAAVPADTADLDGDWDTIEPLPLDLAGHARFIDDPATADTGAGTPPIVDMGAYEFKPAVPGDFDDDDDVDAADLLIFEACATGPGIPYNAAELPEAEPGCTLVPDAQDKIATDFDTDGDVDQSDFGLLQTYLVEVSGQ